jgi:hypothetical protein
LGNFSACRSTLMHRTSPIAEIPHLFLWNSSGLQIPAAATMAPWDLKPGPESKNNKENKKNNG